MKKLKIICIAVLIANAFWGCEKDDLCDETTPTTPKMIVEFYDDNNPSEKKLVNNLGIIAEGETDGLLFNNVSQIQVPLKTVADIAKYSFILDSQNPDASLQDEDKIEINYTRKDVYISRACGFKTLFTLKNPNGMVLTSVSDNWIQQILIQKHNILNEDEVHVKIFF
jgi:hypothetical protein